MTEETKQKIESTGTDASTAVSVSASYDGMGGSGMLKVVCIGSF